jgi:hypothetical protein
MADITVMEHNEENIEDELFQKEYEEAVIKGFVGTYEEYLQYRDFT